MAGVKGRRRSPVPSRKHGERNEKGGGSGLAMPTSTLLGTPAGPNPGSNSHLSPATSGNVALPVTPSTQSLSFAVDDRSLHMSPMPATPTTILPGSLDVSATSPPSATTLTSAKTIDEQSLLDDDAVIHCLFIPCQALETTALHFSRSGDVILLFWWGRNQRATG